MTHERFNPFTPIGDKLVVEPAKPKEKSDSGLLYIPDVAQNSATMGLVISVGNETKLIKVNDLVFFPKFNSAEMEWSGKKYYVIKEVDIFCRIEPTKAE